jgi:hypothetical protein
VITERRGQWRSLLINLVVTYEEPKNSCSDTPRGWTAYKAKCEADALERLEATIDKYRGEDDTQTMLKMASDIRYLSHAIDTLVRASKHGRFN